MVYWTAENHYPNHRGIIISAIAAVVVFIVIWLLITAFQPAYTTGAFDTGWYNFFDIQSKEFALLGLP